MDNKRIAEELLTVAKSVHAKSSLLDYAEINWVAYISGEIIPEIERIDRHAVADVWEKMGKGFLEVKMDILSEDDVERIFERFVKRDGIFYVIENTDGGLVTWRISKD